MKVLNLDEAMYVINNTNTFDSIFAYTYTYSNDDSILFESNVIDDSDDTDITLDYLLDVIPKRITILDTEANIVIKFTHNNYWAVYYEDDNKNTYCDTYGNDLIKILQEISEKTKNFDIIS